MRSCLSLPLRKYTKHGVHSHLIVDSGFCRDTEKPLPTAATGLVFSVPVMFAVTPAIGLMPTRSYNTEGSETHRMDKKKNRKKRETICHSNT